MKWLFFKSKNQKRNNPPDNNQLGKQAAKNIDLFNEEATNKPTESYDEIIGRMSAFFAHEIRNPLTSIIGFAQFLEQDETIKSNPNLSQYLSIIKDEALRMESLIKELLSLSTTDFQQDSLSIIDVKSIIEKMIIISKMRPNDKNITFLSDLEPETYIKGNANRFEQLLINLINNAIEASGEECTIDIQLKKDDEYVSIFITDNGSGIAAEQIDQIFYPLFTTKDEGTGVGLPVCKAIIETLRGTISIQNHSPKGTQVKMRIPLVQHTS